MDELRLAQINSCSQLSSRWTQKIWKEIDVNYCVQNEPHQTKNIIGSTYLHAAARKLHYDFVKELLNEGADLLKQTVEGGRTPLLQFMYLYSSKNHMPIWKMLGELKHEMIDILLSAQVKTGNALNPRDENGISHFHVACAVNHVEAVKFFLEAGTPINQVINVDDHHLPGYTALHFAIRYSAVETVNVLVDNGADIHLKDAQNRSSLHLLIERLMDLTDYIIMGKRACCSLCRAEIGCVESMLHIIFNSKVADEMNFIDDTGLTAFHIACTMTDISFVESFLERNVNINASISADANFWPGSTPLHFAACSNVETVKLLLQRGSNIIKNAAGKTPLDLCMERYSPETIHSILSCKPEFKNIVLSDVSTSLLDVLMLMNDCDKFSNFLQNSKNVELSVPHDSPLWPGNTLLHLSLLMNEKTKTMKKFYDTLISEENTDSSPESYNCSEKEELAYWKRIVICLVRGCSVTTKNGEGLTPIHLAFKLRKTNVVDKFLNSCKSDVADPNNLTHFHIACVIGKKNLVEKFLSDGVDVNSQVKSSFDWPGKSRIFRSVPFSITVRANSTPLHLSVIFEHLEIVQLLLQSGADIYAQGVCGSTPIHHSINVDLEFRSIAQLLLKEAGTNLKEVVSKQNLTHLHVAAWANDGQAVDKLLEIGSDVDAVFDYTVKQRNDYRDKLSFFAGETPLYIAVKEDSVDAVRSLIRAGADISKRTTSGCMETPFMEALCYIDSDATKCLIRKAKREFKEIVGPVDENGVTMLHVACATFDLVWVKKLLENGADVNAQMRDDDEREDDIWKGQTPLHVLVNEAYNMETLPENMMKLVKLLLKYGADVTIKDTVHTPLHEVYQMTYGNEKDLSSSMVDAFLKSHKSYDVNPTDDTRLSHAHIACIRNKAEIVEKFLDSGVDVNHRVSYFSLERYSGFTCLHFALEYGHVDLARLLIDRGADVNAEATNGNRPLHVAAIKNCMDLGLLEVLYRKGADFNAKNLKDMTPLMHVFMLENFTLEQLDFFLKRNARFDATHIQSLQGILGLAVKNAKSCDREMIFQKLIKTVDITGVIDDGFNAIRSIVLVNQNGSLTQKFYVNAIKQLMKMGCDLDQQNEYGKTPIYDAILYCNLEAIKALLQLGVDINIVDAQNNSPLSTSVIADNKATKQRSYSSLSVLFIHAFKMKLSGLALKSSVEKDMSSLPQDRCVSCSSHELYWQSELTKMDTVKISDSFTAKSFLREGPFSYHLVTVSERKVVDEFFKNSEDVTRRFPEYGGLLIMQYRKAVSKLKSLDCAEK